MKKDNVEFIRNFLSYSTVVVLFFTVGTPMNIYSTFTILLTTVLMLLSIDNDKKEYGLIYIMFSIAFLASDKFDMVNF